MFAQFLWARYQMDTLDKSKGFRKRSIHRAARLISSISQNVNRSLCCAFECLAGVYVHMCCNPCGFFFLFFLRLCQLQCVILTNCFNINHIHIISYYYSPLIV